MFCGQTPCTFPSRLKWVLLFIVVCLANNVNLEELLEEIGALRETLLQQNNFLSSLGDPLPNTGCWYYVPSNQNVRNMLFWHEKRNTLVFFYCNQHVFFVLRPLVLDLRAHKTQDWALCTHSPLRKASGPSTEHTGKDLLMEDTGSIPPIRTIMEREASAMEPQFRVFLSNVIMVNIMSVL